VTGKNDGDPSHGEALNHVAIITGGGTGIGAATARRLAAGGFDLVLVGRREEQLEAVRTEIGGGTLALADDVGDPGAPRRIVEATLRRFGRVDVLINNAAVIQNGPLESFTRDVFEQHYAVNVAGPFFLLAAALDALRASPSPAVVNISSSVGSIVKPGSMLYGSTKAALEYLTRAWAYELAVDRIRVNCVAPGPIDTPIHTTYTDDLDATYADLARRVPLGRMASADEIAVWVSFLVSNETEWTTGNVINVDGGQVLGLPESAGG
jgi:NAD(P)-dependent dehydrogenase (short-subunit alcohol dehydrogenase family)